MGEIRYTRGQLTRVLRLRAGQVRRWQRWALLPRRRLYGWPELVRARLLGELEAKMAAPQQVRRSVLAVARRQPELTDPLAEAGWEVVAGRVEVHYGGVCMDAVSGQLRLPFSPPAAPASRPAAAAAEAWFLLGLSLEADAGEANAGKRTEAAAAYERCLELDAGFASAHLNLGTLRYHEKDYAAAERSYRAALELDANYALAHFNLGNVLDETGRLDEAIGAYLEAVRLAPGYADAHYNLALAYQRQGERRRAVPHWRQYLGLDRQSPWAAHARTQLQQALARDPLKLVPKAALRQPEAS